MSTDCSGKIGQSYQITTASHHGTWDGTLQITGATTGIFTGVTTAAEKVSTACGTDGGRDYISFERTGKHVHYKEACLQANGTYYGPVDDDTRDADNWTATPQGIPPIETR